MMPWQLKRGLAARVKGAPPRPIVENLPAIAVHQLPIPSLNDPKKCILPNVSLRWPHISACKVSRDCVEFHIPSLHRSSNGPVQSFRLKHFRVGYGIAHAFVCDCGRSVRKLYYLNRRIACRRCQNAIYASQSLSQQQRPALQQVRIQSFLDNKSRLRHRTQEYLRQKLGEKALLAQGKQGTRALSLLD